jgi:hypothetical protein
VLTQIEFARNVLVRAAFGDQLNQSLLALGEQGSALGVGDGRRRSRERVNKIADLFVAGPNLAFVNFVHALAQNFKGLGAREHTLGAGSECVHHGMTLGNVQEKNRASFRKFCDEFTEGREAGGGAVFELSTDDRDVRVVLIEGGLNFAGIGG